MKPHPRVADASDASDDVLSPREGFTDFTEVTLRQILPPLMPQLKSLHVHWNPGITDSFLEWVGNSGPRLRVRQAPWSDRKEASLGRARARFVPCSSGRCLFGCPPRSRRTREAFLFFFQGLGESVLPRLVMRGIPATRGGC